jgi:hypothetical protein
VYRQLADGPVRAVFQIQYDWIVNGKPVTVTEQISIWGGQYFYESKVWVTGMPEGAKLVTGVADFYENSFEAYPIQHTNVLFSYGRQSENKDYLGLAVLAPLQNFSFDGSAPRANSDVLDSWLSVQNLKKNQPCLFRFYAAWEKTEERFARVGLFKKFISREAVKMSDKILMNW